MADHSPIEWTDATWNPVRGCSRITTGCGGPNHEGGCYAEKIAARFSDPGQPFHGFAERTPYGGRWTGKLALIDEQLTLPLRWKRPRKIFVNSMSDLFHENLPDEAIDKVFAVMALCPQHTFQVLTKRAERMRAYMSDPLQHNRMELAAEAIRPSIGKPWSPKYVLPRILPNVWLGVSAERQEEADERIPHLIKTPATVRFISAEPLLGPIDLTRFSPVDADWNPRAAAIGNLIGLDWIIVGGESGHNARPMHPAWARSLRDQCAAAGVPFFFKQWGEWGEPCVGGAKHLVSSDGSHVDDREWEKAVGFNYPLLMSRVGKKAAGRLLDGREHNEFPRGGA
jgi:protein gp37